MKLCLCCGEVDFFLRTFRSTKEAALRTCSNSLRAEARERTLKCQK